MTSSRHNLSNKINGDQLTLFRSLGDSVRLDIEPGEKLLRFAHSEGGGKSFPARERQGLQGQVLRLYEKGGVYLPGVAMMKKEIFV